MVCIALAGIVVVTDVMVTTLDGCVFWADANDSSDAAAARADTNLIESMMRDVWEMGGGGGRWRGCRLDEPGRAGDVQPVWSSRCVQSRQSMFKPWATDA
jgi:hypothetical protein